MDYAERDLDRCGTAAGNYRVAADRERLGGEGQRRSMPLPLDNVTLPYDGIWPMKSRLPISIPRLRRMLYAVVVWK